MLLLLLQVLVSHIRVAVVFQLHLIQGLRLSVHSTAGVRWGGHLAGRMSISPLQSRVSAAIRGCDRSFGNITENRTVSCCSCGSPRCRRRWGRWRSWRGCGGDCDGCGGWWNGGCGHAMMSPRVPHLFLIRAYGGCHFISASFSCSPLAACVQTPKCCRNDGVGGLLVLLWVYLCVCWFCLSAWLTQLL